ncbi:hypothetical protein Pint_08429 [Pistacia integerrima]|uniref:Uncharacterized protein n=1 Tax=Pistacia integerrima TaxID=434235 RepID=A0ACC0XTM2_9ROSI|nr:hypothetical protein Pint_08429 [Pistacia integerrima]
MLNVLPVKTCSLSQQLFSSLYFTTESLDAMESSGCFLHMWCPEATRLISVPLLK